MEKAYKVIIAFFIAAVLCIGSLLGVYLNLTGKAIDIPEIDVLYYGLTCSHCKIVEDFIEKNNIEDKIKIEKKEVYENRENAEELARVAKSLGINASEIGIPFLYYDGKAYMGDVDIIELLKREAKLV
jgi:glutaredoxin